METCNRQLLPLRSKTFYHVVSVNEKKTLLLLICDAVTLMSNALTGEGQTGAFVHLSLVLAGSLE